MIVIDYDKCCWKNGKCTSCGCGSSNSVCEGCVEACPVGALERKKILILDTDKCVDCGACISACKHDALSQN